MRLKFISQHLQFFVKNVTYKLEIPPPQTFVFEFSLFLIYKKCLKRKNPDFMPDSSPWKNFKLFLSPKNPNLYICGLYYEKKQNLIWILYFWKRKIYPSWFFWVYTKSEPIIINKNLFLETTIFSNTIRDDNKWLISLDCILNSIIWCNT